MRFVYARLYLLLIVFNSSLSWASFDLTKDVRLTLQNVATSEDALRLNFGNKEPAAALIDVANGEKFSIHSQAKAHSLGHKDYSLGSKDTAEGILGSSRSRNLNSNQDGGSGSFVSGTSMPASFFIASGDSSSNSPRALSLSNDSSKVFYNQKLSGFNLKADRYAQLTSEGLEKSVQEKFLSDVDQNNSYANLSKIKGLKGSMVASNLPKYNSYSGMNAAFPSIVIPSSLDAGSKEAGSKGFDSVPETSSGSDGNSSHAKADSQSPAKAVRSESTETSSATPSSGSHASPSHSTSTPSSEITSSNPAPKVEGESSSEKPAAPAVSDSKRPTSEPKKTEVYAYHDKGDEILDKPLINAGKISLGNAALPSLPAPSLWSDKPLGIGDVTPDTSGLLSLNPGGGLFQQNANHFQKAVYWAANESGGYTGYDAHYKEVAFSLMEPVVFGKLKTKEEIQEGQKLFTSLKKPITPGKLDLGSVAINTPSAPSLFGNKPLSIGDATTGESSVPGFNLKVDPTVGANKLGLESVALNAPSAPSLFRNQPLSIRDATTGEGIAIGKPSGTKALGLDFRITPPEVKAVEEKTHTEQAASPGAVSESGVAGSSGSQDETPKNETVSLNTPAVLSIGGSAVTQENKGLSLGLGAGPIGLGGNSSLVASMSLNQDLNFPSKKLEANSLHYAKQDTRKMDEHINKKSRCDVARSRFKKYYQSHLTSSTKVDQSDGVAYCYNSSNVKDAPDMLKDVQWRCSHLAQKVVVDPDFSNRKYCIVLKRESDLTREKLLGSYEAVHAEYKSLTDLLYPESAPEAPSASSTHN
jgi:hypothetical protein